MFKRFWRWLRGPDYYAQGYADAIGKLKTVPVHVLMVACVRNYMPSTRYCEGYWQALVDNTGAQT